ncbi:SMP-30/gluconolactonase/LRE family protein [Nonomuraea sp. KM90]|uniref:SMP-30/gluconolactonase/LRE family protein n=1 Tax=Nonomuraea sp. KM90 TaxID=3457428 RepID=UPI003FCE90CB
MRSTTRRRLLALAAIAVPLLADGTAQAAERSAPSQVSVAYELPGDRVYPEGIAADPHTGDLYTGSGEDGTIFTMRPGHRVAEVFLPAGADGRTVALGLEVDRARRLWAIDRSTGVAVYDIPSRRLLARFTPPAKGKSEPLVNDLAIAPDGTAYITDSFRTVVYRVTPWQLARARERGRETPLTPAFDLAGVVDPYEPGKTVTLNGIVAEPSGRYLLTADMRGALYRIDLHSGVIRKVTLRGGDMSLADGMELRNGKLWVAHPIIKANAISRWRVTADGRAAMEEGRITDQALQLPTHLLHRQGRLYVVRSQLDKGSIVDPDGGLPRIPFTIASVRGI